LDCSGKTTFAKTLYGNLNHRNIKSTLLHIDDYNNTDVQELIYGAHERGDFTEDMLNLYYSDSIDYDAVADALTLSRKNFDVTIIEGVFLFKDCLRHFLDIKIFLPVDPAVARKRYENRKQVVSDNRSVTVFDDIWLPAFMDYVREAEPESNSDFIYRQV